MAREQEPGDAEAIQQLLGGSGDRRLRRSGFVAVVSDTTPGTDMSQVRQGRLVGYLGVEAAPEEIDAFVLDPIAVDPGEQGTGVGSQTALALCSRCL